MFMVVFFSWWYGKGWGQVANSFLPRINAVMAGFSVNQLLRTLFAPWRRIISYPGASFSAKFQAWGDNLFSRTIGFIVRLIVLLTSGLIILLTAVLTLIELIIWPLLPPAVIGCLIAGLIL